MSRVRFDIQAVGLDAVSLATARRSEAPAPVLVKMSMLEGKQ